MVKRYGFDQAYTHPPLLFYAKPDGNYTTHDDYAELEAERDVAKQVGDVLKIRLDKVVAERDALREALKAILNDCESVLDQFYPESIALARTALGGE